MNGDVWRAKVTRANANGVWFKVPKKWGRTEFGPFPTLWPAAVAGDTVLVVDTGRQDFVVLGLVYQGVS